MLIDAVNALKLLGAVNKLFIMRFYTTFKFFNVFFRRQAFWLYAALGQQVTHIGVILNVLGCNAALAVEVFLVTLKLVISVAGSFALMVMVGRKSASGLLSGIPIFFFIFIVV